MIGSFVPIIVCYTTLSQNVKKANAVSTSYTEDPYSLNIF